jgi:hypothetical protein
VTSLLLSLQSCPYVDEDIDQFPRVNYTDESETAHSIDLEHLSDQSDVESDEQRETCHLLYENSSISTENFCQQILQLFRSSRLSKTDQRRFLDLIRTALPIPNGLPLNMKRLLRLIGVDHVLYRKRKICLVCREQITESPNCTLCLAANDENSAFIYDFDVAKILSLLLKRFWKCIAGNVTCFRDRNDRHGTNDIGFGDVYQDLLDRFTEETFVTGLLHLDGISLCESSKIKMWLCSMSIVELPPRIRYSRFNMPVISVWIGHREPVVPLWLKETMLTLNRLKISGEKLAC